VRGRVCTRASGQIAWRGEDCQGELRCCAELEEDVGMSMPRKRPLEERDSRTLERAE
jgi:hypothetical protein